MTSITWVSVKVHLLAQDRDRRPGDDGVGVEVVGYFAADVFERRSIQLGRHSSGPIAGERGLPSSPCFLGVEVYVDAVNHRTVEVWSDSRPRRPEGLSVMTRRSVAPYTRR